MSDLFVLVLEEGPVELVAHPVGNNPRGAPVDHAPLLPLHLQQLPVGRVGLCTTRQHQRIRRDRQVIGICDLRQVALQILHSALARRC